MIPKQNRKSPGQGSSVYEDRSEREQCTQKTLSYSHAEQQQLDREGSIAHV